MGGNKRVSKRNGVASTRSFPRPRGKIPRPPCAFEARRVESLASRAVSSGGRSGPPFASNSVGAPMLRQSIYLLALIVAVTPSVSLHCQVACAGQRHAPLAKLAADCHLGPASDAHTKTMLSAASVDTCGEWRAELQVTRDERAGARAITFAHAVLKVAGSQPPTPTVHSTPPFQAPRLLQRRPLVTTLRL